MGKSRKKNFGKKSKNGFKNKRFEKENIKSFKVKPAKTSKGKQERIDKNFNLATGKLIMTTKGFAFVDIKF